MNDETFLISVINDLRASGIEVWIFGGWAEELRGMIDPRPHGDIDLLYPAEDFEAVDKYIAEAGLVEIIGKHLPHKRAFELDGVIIELFLIDPTRLTTNFWGTKLYKWPTDTLGHDQEPMTSSRSALASYRRDWESLRENYPSTT